jgi:hypothetical protein
MSCPDHHEALMTQSLHTLQNDPAIATCPTCRPVLEALAATERALAADRAPDIDEVLRRARHDVRPRAWRWERLLVGIAVAASLLVVAVASWPDPPQEGPPAMPASLVPSDDVGRIQWPTTAEIAADDTVLRTRLMEKSSALDAFVTEVQRRMEAEPARRDALLLELADAYVAMGEWMLASPLVPDLTQEQAEVYVAGLEKLAWRRGFAKALEAWEARASPPSATLERRIAAMAERDPGRLEVDRRWMREALADHAAGVRACAPDGGFVVRVTIEPDGSARSPVAIHGALPDATADCVRQAVEDIRFPMPADGAALAIGHPYVFARP